MRAKTTNQSIKAHQVMWLLAGVLLVASCGESGKKVAPSLGKTGGAAGADGDLGDTSNTADPLAGQSLIDAKYKLKASALGITACKGEVNLKLNAGFGKSNNAAAAQLFEINGMLDCALLGCQIDLGMLLGGATGAAPPAGGDPFPIVVEDGVMHLKEMGPTRYSPPRPFMPAFLSAKRDVLSSLSKTVNATATTADGGSGSGSITLAMLSFGQPYDATEMGKTFDDSMVFELYADGFDGIKKLPALLINRAQMAISLKPLALLHLELETAVGDIVPAGGPPAGGGVPGDGSDCGASLGGLGGGGGSPIMDIAGALAKKIIKLKLTADLIEMKGVDLDTDTGTNSLGEKIGGKPSSSSSSDDSGD